MINMRGEIFCDFCGNSEDEVTTIVAGLKGSICDDCVIICAETIGREGVKKFSFMEKIFRSLLKIYGRGKPK